MPEPKIIHNHCGFPKKVARSNGVMTAPHNPFPQRQVVKREKGFEDKTTGYLIEFHGIENESSRFGLGAERVGGRG